MPTRQKLIIPAIKKNILEDEICDFSSMKILKLSGLAQETIAILKDELPQLSFQINNIQDIFCAEFTTCDIFVKNDLPLEIPKEDEAYVLRISSDSIQINSQSAHGLWNGLQSLQQLIDSGKGILKSGINTDWPTLKVRGVHWDLKGYQPKLCVLKEQLRIISNYKINTVLLELEDKIRYNDVPEVSVAHAYSTNELKEINNYAKALFINIIPKVQCLAHVDYLLKHHEYSHLREDRHPYQYCIRNKESFKLWTSMVDEILDVFPDSQFFHIGADESTHLADCPECIKFSKADNFIYHVGRCIDYIVKKGKTPVFWDDILRNKHGNIDDDDLEKTWCLGEKAIVMYWAYGYDGRNNEFPFLSKYTQGKMRIWGASGFSGCGPSWIQNLPPVKERMLNINAWSKSALEHGLEGFINTGWGKITSGDPGAEIHEACWLPIAFGAEASWNSPVNETREFTRTFLKQFYGVEAPESFIDLMLEPVIKHIDIDELSRIKATKNLSRFELLRELSRICIHDKLRETVLENRRMYHEFLGSIIVDYRHKMIKENVEKFKKSLITLEAATQKQLEQFYLPEGIKLFLNSRFGYDKELLQKMEILLSETKLY